MRVLLAIAVCAIAVLTGCSSGDTDDASPTSTSTPTASPESESQSASVPASPEAAPDELTDEEIAKYFENVFSQQPRLIQKARAMSTPGSAAAIYADYRLASANSNLDGGYPQDAWSVSMGSGQIEACTADNATCTKITKFQSDGTQLTSFKMDGKDMSRRLVQGNATVRPVAGAGNVQFLVANKAVSDDSLIVAIRVQSAGGGLSILDAYYRAKNGRQTASENISGPRDLGANSSATYTMAFPAALPGGTATLNVYVNNGPPIPVSVEVR